MRRSHYLGILTLVISYLGWIGCNSSGTQAVQHPAPTLDTAFYLKRGGEIAASTFKTLSAQLQAALKRGGVKEAVPFCQLKAYPLVDSLSEIHRARIRRTTFKVRNPKDRPDSVETAILKKMEALHAAGQPLRPVIQRLSPDTVLFAAPILTQPFCLQCHGQPGVDIDASDYELIRQLYPHDQAIGYRAGDLRGMWSIRIYHDPEREESNTTPN